MDQNDAPTLSFTDEQLVEAVKAGPPELGTQVAIIAMQLELLARRAGDTEED
jgi:hypothetical protein|tara:strand:- start:263 stop:418 length:156 start_codon:yes stop_codon:yes gene_type:complete